MWSAFPQRALPQANQEDGALAGGVRGEEINDIIVVKGEPAGAQTERIRGKIQLAAENARLQLRGAVTPVAVSRKDLAQIGEKEDVGGSVGGQVLLES